jgi:TonB family protein
MYGSGTDYRADLSIEDVRSLTMRTKIQIFRNWCSKAFAVMLLFGLAGAPKKASSQDKSSSTASVKETGGRKVKSKVAPSYPEVARKMHIAGTVRVEAVVKPDGKVSDVRVLGGSPILAKEVVTAVKNWQYGEGPNETLETLEFSFQY